MIVQLLHSNFLIYEKKLIFFFISAEAEPLALHLSDTALAPLPRPAKHRKNSYLPFSTLPSSGRNILSFSM
jgi:hypothetical protein